MPKAETSGPQRASHNSEFLAATMVAHGAISEERIAARKGTRAEFLDHPLACKPFGFGARMCVGSRVAKLEYMSLICRLIQDFELSVDEDKSVPESERLRLSRATTIEYPCPVFKVKTL